MCVATKIGFLRRAIPPDLLATAEAANTRLMKSTFSIISSIPEDPELDAAWEQIALPSKMHGMGLRCGPTASAAAYIAWGSRLRDRIAWIDNLLLKPMRKLTFVLLQTYPFFWVGLVLALQSPHGVAKLNSHEP